MSSVPLSLSDLIREALGLKEKEMASGLSCKEEPMLIHQSHSFLSVSISKFFHEEYLSETISLNFSIKVEFVLASLIKIQGKFLLMRSLKTLYTYR